jgi:hypothetical protein
MRPDPARARPLFSVATVVVLISLGGTCCAVPARQTPDLPARVLALTDDANVFDQPATLRTNSKLLNMKPVWPWISRSSS